MHWKNSGIQPSLSRGWAFYSETHSACPQPNKALGVANTMAALREEWWIPRLRTLVKKELRNCNVCKVFATKPYGTPTTSTLPEFRTEVSRPFQYVGVDFAGPLKVKVNKKKEEKALADFHMCDIESSAPGADQNSDS